MATAREIVEKYLAALKNHDYAAIRRLVQDDLSVEGPIQSFHDADSYVEGLKQMDALVERIDVKKLFADGNDVCLLYDMVTNIAGTVFIAEWYQVSNDKIRFVRGVYDPKPFAWLAGR